MVHWGVVCWALTGVEGMSKWGVMSDLNQQCDCRTHESRARILRLDGSEIATGSLRLESPHADGRFVPDGEFQPPRELDRTPHPEVEADLGTHRHRLLKWRICTGTDAKHYRKQDDLAHFHFDEAE
jgi:hypothetical protein